MSPNKVLIVVLSVFVIVACLTWIIHEYKRLNPEPETGAVIVEPGALGPGGMPPQMPPLPEAPSNP